MRLQRSSIQDTMFQNDLLHPSLWAHIPVNLETLKRISLDSSSLKDLRLLTCISSRPDMDNQKDNQRKAQTLANDPVSESRCKSELSFRERRQLYHTNSCGQRIDTTTSHERPSTGSTHLAPQSTGTSVSTLRETALDARLSRHDPAQRVSAEARPDLPDVTAHARVSTRNAIFDQQRRQYEARKQEAAERAAARVIRLAIECAQTRTVPEISQVRRNSMEKVIKSFDMVEKEDDEDDVLSESSIDEELDVEGWSIVDTYGEVDEPEKIWLSNRNKSPVPDYREKLAIVLTLFATCS